MSEKKIQSRRTFLKSLGGATLATGAIMAGCKNPNTTHAEGFSEGEIPTDKMTYRENQKGEKVSLLGYGCMRFPTLNGESGREDDNELDQEQVNKLVDYAIAHGVNLFDTAPPYCKGRSEHAVGIALSRHKRSEYFISTKLSNFSCDTWSREASMALYRNSLKELQVDYLDYVMMHGIGMPGVDEKGNDLSGMEAFKRRYIDNGMLDFLLSEREAGRIRNLGFSYHGDVEVFDYLLSLHDQYHWNHVLIQHNYVDWHHAKEMNPRNTNSEYLYGELEKRGIPVFVMEPLLGGRLATLTDSATEELQNLNPESSIASWAFRFAGQQKGILTVLSGMTYMEHLQDNIRTYSPHVPLNEHEMETLEQIADVMAKYPAVPCTSCKYCMPCPYGLDIPTIFGHFNKCLNEGHVIEDNSNSEYRKARRAFLVGYDRSVPKLRQASHCISCGKCMSHCPQGINIPSELKRIDQFVEHLKINGKLEQ